MGVGGGNFFVCVNDNGVSVDNCVVSNLVVVAVTVNEIDKGKKA